MADQADFRDCVASRQRYLLRTAWLLTGDWASAEDLVQTVLARCWPHWDRVASTGGADAYVNRALINAWKTSRRRLWRGEVPSESLPDRGANDADPTTRGVLVKAVRDLPPRQRAVITLRFLADLSESATAQALGCSAGTVKSQTSKALMALRAHPQLADVSLEELR